MEESREKTKMLNQNILSVDQIRNCSLPNENGIWQPSDPSIREHAS